MNHSLTLSPSQQRIKDPLGLMYITWIAYLSNPFAYSGGVATAHRSLAAV